MKTRLLAIALCFITLPAAAAQWELVDVGSPEFVEFVDTDSIRFEKELVYYWRRTIMTGEKNPLQSTYGPKAESLKTFAVEDCRNAIYKPLQSVVLDAYGASIDMIHHKEHPKPVGPWSTDLERHQFVCSKKPTQQAAHR